MNYELLDSEDFYSSVRSYMGGGGEAPWTPFVTRQYFRWWTIHMEMLAHPVEIEDLYSESFKLADLEHYHDIIIWQIIYRFFNEGWFEGDEEGEVQSERWMEMRNGLILFLDEPPAEQYICCLCNSISENGIYCTQCDSWTLLERVVNQPLPSFNPAYIQELDVRTTMVNSLHLHGFAVNTHNLPLLMVGVFCPCCQYTNDERKIVTLNLCMHRFHGICIRQYFLSQVLWKCPVCRMVYHEVDEPAPVMPNVDFNNMLVQEIDFGDADDAMMEDDGDNDDDVSSSYSSGSSNDDDRGDDNEEMGINDGGDDDAMVGINDSGNDASSSSGSSSSGSGSDNDSSDNASSSSSSDDGGDPMNVDRGDYT